MAAIALAAGVLAGGGPVAAQAHSGSAGMPRAGSAAGVITTVVGGVGGPARATQVELFNRSSGGAPCGVSYSAGQLYIGDSVSVRRVNPSTDRLTTPAGTGRPGPLGDGGPATQASMDACYTAVAASGNLVISDTIDNRVRMVAASTGTFYGQPMTAGDIYTVAGNGTSGFAGDGGPAASAEVSVPSGVTADAAGNLVFADLNNNRVRVVAARGGTFYGVAMTAGDIYTVAGNGSNGFAGDGGPATSAELGLTHSLARDAAGDLLIADYGNSRIRKVTP